MWKLAGSLALRDYSCTMPHCKANRFAPLQAGWLCSVRADGSDEGHKLIFAFSLLPCPCSLPTVSGPWSSGSTTSTTMKVRGCGLQRGPNSAHCAAQI